MHINIKNFLNNLSFDTLRETSPTNDNFEHYFLAIRNEFLNKNDQNIEVLQFLSDYSKKFPLHNLSQASLDYINDNNYTIIYIDTLNKKDKFYVQESDFVINNAHNIISKKFFNEYCDTKGLVGNMAQEYFSIANIIRKATMSVIASKIKEHEVEKKVVDKINHFKKMFK